MSLCWLFINIKKFVYTRNSPACTCTYTHVLQNVPLCRDLKSFLAPCQVMYMYMYMYVWYFDNYIQCMYMHKHLQYIPHLFSKSGWSQSDCVNHKYATSLFYKWVESNSSTIFPNFYMYFRGLSLILLLQDYSTRSREL